MYLTVPFKLIFATKAENLLSTLRNLIMSQHCPNIQDITCYPSDLKNVYKCICFYQSPGLHLYEVSKTEKSQGIKRWLTYSTNRFNPLSSAQAVRQVTYNADANTCCLQELSRLRPQPFGQIPEGLQGDKLHTE